MTKSRVTVNVLNEIRQVLEIEIEALQSVRDHLNESFVQAVEAIHASKGQVIVTGIGKSGMVANKVAATLRSTGTPAIFLHAGEALHGDVGMVGAEDVVLAIGKSGETGELNSLLRVLKKTDTFIISMTTSPGSAMASLSNIVLDLRIPREACPLNLAPTASTTAALAVGDALAVALMKLNQTSKEDFARRHPGGQLGARLLLTVSDVMRKGEENPVIRVDQSVKEMLVRITGFRVGAISVIDDGGRLLGLVTDYDIRRALESETSMFSRRIADIMNPNPETVFADEKAMDALESMRRRQKPTAVLPVVNRDGTSVGMLHLHDLLAAGL